MRLFILGATGGTGAQLTRQALERGHAITAFVRSPDKMQTRHEKLVVASGDPRDADQLREALRGHDAVLSALGATGTAAEGILETAARSTVQAMRQSGVPRLVVVSMALLFPDVGLLGPILRFFLRRQLRDSAAMERVVAASDLDWTVVRPPRLTNGQPTGRYRVSEQQAPPGFSIPRADLALAILDLIETPAYIKKVIGVSR